MNDLLRTIAFVGIMLVIAFLAASQLEKDREPVFVNLTDVR